MTELDGDDENLLRYGAEETFTNKGWRELEKDIQHLLKVLQASPVDSRSLSDIHFEGKIYRTKSRKPDWVELFAELDGDTLRFRRLDGKFKGECRICYVFTTRVTKEDDLIDKTGLKLRQRIIIITQDDVLHIAMESEDDTKMWLDVLKRLLKAKYSREELRHKEDAKKDLQPLLVEQESMKMKRFKMIVNTLKESGFFISPKLKKEMEGHLELKRRGKEWKKLYVVLFKDYLYMFKPHIKVSLDTQPYDWIDLQYVTGLRPSKEKRDCFVIFTAMRKFVFRAKHEIAVSEWINGIADESSRKTSAPTSSVSIEADHKGYMYSKPIDDRIILTIDCPESDRPRQKKLGRASEHTVGRSSSCNVVIKEDKFISRAHVKISIEDNVPFLVDLGTSTGTKLNGRKVVKCALAPGDVFEIGKSRITFDIKDAESIFHIDSDIAALNEAAKAADVDRRPKSPAKESPKTRPKSGTSSPAGDRSASPAVQRTASPSVQDKKDKRKSAKSKEKNVGLDDVFL